MIQPDAHRIVDIATATSPADNAGRGAAAGPFTVRMAMLRSKARKPGANVNVLLSGEAAFPRHGRRDDGNTIRATKDPYSGRTGEARIYWKGE